MNSRVNRALILTAALASTPAFAAETTINGFASFVGGTTVKSTDLPNGEQSEYVADRGYVRNADGEINRDAIYRDSVSYRPDTNYGVQFKSDLTKGLTVTAQLTGRGSQDFKTELDWAYVTYELSPKAAIQAGRQRLPLYYYSDFIDVGYAYHWLRPPVDVYGNTLTTYEGVSLMYNGNLGDWTTQSRLYTGTSNNENTRFGNFSTEGFYGAVVDTNNSWLRLRFSFIVGDFYVEDTPVDKDQARASAFGSFAAHLTLGNGFIVSEITNGEILDGKYLHDGTAAFDALGSFMVSAGYQFDTVTPHITYSDSNVDFYGEGPYSMFKDWYIKSETITAGLRWDFHPSAALKIEYSSAKDKSTTQLVQIRGKVEEADVLAVGFDVIF